MKEELLHYLWKTKRIDLDGLVTTDGEPVKILKAGVHNHNAGPDFLNGRVKIGSTEWNGHIEFHIRSSDWDNHKHRTDPAYNNVILHIVDHYDRKVYNANGQVIPTIVIKNRYSAHTVDHYEKLMLASNWIPCEEHLSSIDKKKLPFFLEKLLTDRLIRKSLSVNLVFRKANNDWEQTLYSLIFKYVGSKVNQEACLLYTSPSPRDS